MTWKLPRDFPPPPPDTAWVEISRGSRVVSYRQPPDGVLRSTVFQRSSKRSARSAFAGTSFPSGDTTTNSSPDGLPGSANPSPRPPPPQPRARPSCPAPQPLPPPPRRRPAATPRNKDRDAPATAASPP